MTERPRSLLSRAGTAGALVRLAGIYLVFATLKHVVPVQRLAAWGWPRRMRPWNEERERLAIARVIRVRRAMGSSDDCLQASLLLYRELARCGADPKLHIAMAPGTRPISGHSWVELRGAAVGELPAELASFAVVGTFGTGGQVEPTPRD